MFQRNVVDICIGIFGLENGLHYETDYKQHAKSCQTEEGSHKRTNDMYSH